MTDLEQKAREAARVAYQSRARVFGPALDAAITAYLAALPPQSTGEAVGEAGTMPGTDGFTMAVFRAADVPVGTKLYAHPASAQQETVAVSLAKQTKADLAAAHEEICKLQGLDPATHSWPIWSSPAHTTAWCDRIIAGAHPAPAAGVKVDAVMAIIDAWMEGYDFVGTGSNAAANAERKEWEKDRARILSALDQGEPK